MSLSPTWSPPSPSMVSSPEALELTARRITGDVQENAQPSSSSLIHAQQTHHPLAIRFDALARGVTWETISLRAPTVSFNLGNFQPPAGPEAQNDYDADDETQLPHVSPPMAPTREYSFQEHSAYQVSAGRINHDNDVHGSAQSRIRFRARTYSTVERNRITSCSTTPSAQLRYRTRMRQMLLLQRRQRALYHRSPVAPGVMEWMRENDVIVDLALVGALSDSSTVLTQSNTQRFEGFRLGFGMGLEGDVESSDSEAWVHGDDIVWQDTAGPLSRVWGERFDWGVRDGVREQLVEFSGDDRYWAAYVRAGLWVDGLRFIADGTNSRFVVASLRMEAARLQISRTRWLIQGAEEHAAMVMVMQRRRQERQFEHTRAHGAPSRLARTGMGQRREGIFG